MTTIILKKVTCSFPKLFVKEAYKNNSPKYSCRFSFPKDTEMGIANYNAIQNAISENISRNNQDIRTPLRDGDQEKWSGSMGTWIVVGSAKDPAVILDSDNSDIVSSSNKHDKIYTGAIVDAVLDIYYFKEQDGIFCTIKGVQFVEHGEKAEYIQDPEESASIKNIFADSSENMPGRVSIGNVVRHIKQDVKSLPSKTDIYDEDIPF